MARFEPRVLYPGDIDLMVAENNPATYPLRMLAEGDSWFSFGSWKLNSFLNHLRLKQPSVIVTLAHPGETISRMASICGNPELDNWLSTPYSNIAFNAVLISGGGNDVIDDALAGAIIPHNGPQPLKPAAQYIHQPGLQQAIAKVQEGYRKIVALRDRPNSPCIGVPLITHAYDYVTPRNSPAQFWVPISGPWLYTAMMQGGVPQARWDEVSDLVIDALGEGLVALEQELHNFHVAPTRGTLTRAPLGSIGRTLHWDNEIHPNSVGYHKLAQPLADLIDALT